MKVFKFGGASVKDAEAVKNIASILEGFRKEKLVMVVSAMGKTTNALEGLVESHFHQKNDLKEKFDKLKLFHLNVCSGLFNSSGLAIIQKELESLFIELETVLNKDAVDNYNFEYAQIVCFGELLSTKIIAIYLKENGMQVEWVDARKVIKTDHNYREGQIDWEATIRNTEQTILPLLHKDTLIITQGFIGSTFENLSTTLGREGSDYTAAILGAILNAEHVAVWKDVPGILNADPKRFNFAKKIPKLSYKEAIEMTYYGAKVLHPKTIKPLENKGIPLLVKSFLDSNEEGTVIEAIEQELLYPPITIVEPNQILLSIYTTDFSFVSENDISRIFKACSKHNVRVNMMQNKAISMNLCCTNKGYMIEPLVKELKKDFKVEYTSGLDLLTIRHYNIELIYELSKSREIIMEQKSENTYQVVTKTIA